MFCFLYDSKIVYFFMKKEGGIAVSLKKAIVIVMSMLMLSGCSPFADRKDPILKNEAFDIIGDQGIKESATLSELQGDYSGKLWFKEHEKSMYSSLTFDCIGNIDGNVLTLSWIMDGKAFQLEEGTKFSLKKGIIRSSETPDPKLICAVKVYPSGHMVDGLAILTIDDGKGKTEVRVHFQLVR